MVYPGSKHDEQGEVSDDRVRALIPGRGPCGRNSRRRRAGSRVYPENRHAHPVDGRIHVVVDRAVLDRVERRSRSAARAVHLGHGCGQPGARRGGHRVSRRGNHQHLQRRRALRAVRLRTRRLGRRLPALADRLVGPADQHRLQHRGADRSGTGVQLRLPHRRPVRSDRPHPELRTQPRGHQLRRG